MAGSTIASAGGFAGWRMVRVAFLVDFIAVGFFFYSFGIFYPAIAAEFGEGYWLVSLGIAVSNFVSGIFGPFVGRALDRRPLKHMMLVGAVVVSAGFACLSQTRTLWQYYLVLGTFFAFGLGMMGGMASMKLIANWFEVQRGRAMGIATMGISLSGLVMPTVATWLRDEWGWRDGFLAYSVGILVIVVPVVALFVVTRPADLGQRPDGDEPADGADAEARPEHIWTTGEILRSPAFWLISVSFAMVFSALSAILVHLPPHAATLGFTGYQPGLVLSAGAGMGVLGKFYFGWLADRRDPRVAVLISFGAQIVGLGLIMNAAAFTALLAGGAVFGFGMGGVVPLQGTVTSKVFGHLSFGAVMGLTRPVQVSIHAPGIPLAAWIYDTSGSFEQAFWIFLGVYVVSCLLISRLRTEAPEAGANA